MISLEHLSIAVSTLAFQEVEAKHAKESNADKSELYPQLSQNLKALKAAKPTAPKWFSQKLKSSLKEITKSEIVVKNGRAGGFSDYWRGLRAEVANVNKPLSPLQRYEQLLYQQGAEFGLNGGISKALFAENFPEVDLARSDEWCVSLNGENIIAADDYYSGNFAEFKEAHDKAISQAEGEHKRKLIAQLQNAESRLLKSDVSQLEFSINSTLFDLQTKCNFLNQHMRAFHGSFVVSSTEGGKGKIEFKASTNKYDSEERKDKIAALKRLALYASGNTGFTSGKKGEEDKRVRKELKTYLRLANAQFTSWVQADSVMMSRINEKVNNPAGLQFKSTENGEPIQIEGIKESFKPRAHQAAFVRQQSRKMGGILGFDVGLGKTFSALLAVQHLQSISVKNKTIFIVPSSTFTNWKKEAETIYTDEVMARCLFVGLSTDKNGEATYKSSEVVTDLAKIVENKHDKLFMTYEGFKAISLGDQTIEDYLRYLQEVDETLQFSDKNKENEQIKSDAEKLKKRLIKDMKGKLLETMGVDSLVIDEAHNFKNGKTADFGSRIRYMSTVNEASARALDTLIKSWYIRNENKQKYGKSDGVLALTATPVTNSPLEIYSMLSLAVGEQEVNRLCGVNGPDQFLEMFCLIDTREERSVDDLDIEIECFTGLRNIDLLRKLMNSVATMKSADDLPDKQGYSIPDEETIVSSVPLSDEIKQNLGQLKLRYQIGKMIAKGKDIPPHLQMAAVEVEQYAKEIGLPVETLGHAFNFISRQSKSILDKDLSDETSRFYVQKKQADLARQVVEAFNKKPLVDRGRTNLIGITDEPYEYDVKASKANADGEVIVESKDVYNVTVLAKFEEETGLIHFNSVSYEAQTKLRELAEKYGLDLDVSLSPKLSALLDNVKAELANPQAKGGIAKQIIFTEELGMHQKIKQALIAKCGIPSGKIAIINAQAIPDNADLQAVQDGFNADDDGENQNRYQIVIANKKAEVGINLQKGTQAIHHLDINWTPDSIQQRNGRGVRQGNYLAKEGIKVRVYHYDVKGTFDSYKRNVVNQKADWIGSLLYGESNRILASQDTLSVQQQAELAELTGDEEAMVTKMAEILEENRQKAVKSAREDVLLSYQQMEVARIALTNLQSFENYLTPLFASYTDDVQGYADFTLAKVRKIQGEITDEKAKLQSDEKGSPTYNKRLKTLEVLQEKLDKAEGNARKTWAVVMHKYAKLDERLSTTDVPLDQDAARNFLAISEVKQAAVEAGENHTLFEQYENDRAVKEQMMHRYQANIERKQEETGVTLERLREGSRTFVFNGLPLCEGDFVETSNDGVLWLVESYNDTMLFLYSVKKEGVWQKRSEAQYHRLYTSLFKDIGNVVTKGSQQAYEIYPQLAVLDKGENINQRWAKIVPQVTEFADENESIALGDNSGAWSALKIGYLLSEFSLNLLEEQMPELAKEVIKDYAANGIFRNEEGNLEVKSSFDFSAINPSAGAEQYISDYALKHNYRLTSVFAPKYAWVKPSFHNLDNMGYFETPEYDLSDCVPKMKEAIAESSNPAEKTTALRKICQQTLIDLGIVDEALAKLIVSNYRSYRLASKYDNVFIRLSHLYADALNGVGVFAETETVSNSESSTPASGQILPDFYIITGDTSRGGYDNFRDKVEGAIKNAGISHLTKWTGVLWVTDHTFESFKSTILSFWKQHGQKEIISANVARNQWLIHKDVWDALLNYDPQGLKQHGISVRTV